MEIRNAISLALIITATVLVTKIISERYNELTKISESIDELYYYVNEDVSNGNLKPSIKWAYLKELDKISESIEELKKWEITV